MTMAPETETAPSPERLISHASALDSAILERQRQRAVAAADRLVVDLLRHEQHLERLERVDRSVAERLARANLALRAGVLLLAEKLRAGHDCPRANVSRRVQELISAEAVSAGRSAGPPAR
jgi:hypothetical protein